MARRPIGWAEDIADDEWPDALISAVEEDLAALASPRAIATLKAWQASATQPEVSAERALATRRLDAICRAIKSPERSAPPMFHPAEATVRHAGDDDLELPPVDTAMRLPTSAFVLPGADPRGSTGLGARVEMGSKEAIDVRGEEPLDLDLGDDLGPPPPMEDLDLPQGGGTEIIEDAEIVDETPSDLGDPDLDTTDELTQAPEPPRPLGDIPPDQNATVQWVLPPMPAAAPPSPPPPASSQKRAPPRRARKGGAAVPKGR